MSPRPFTPGKTVALEPCAKRVRVFFAGEAVADSRRVCLLHERDHVPVYYFPWEDIRRHLLVPGDRTTHCPRKGDARYWTVRVHDRRAENGLWSYPDPLPHCPDIGNLAAFYWDAMDAWFEEDEEVFVHPRDPYTRIDLVPGSRRVRVSLGDTTVADSRRPMMLFETGLPVRYYLPKADIRMAYLRPTATETACPYKGITSRYWSINANGRTLTDAAWCYEFPRPEVAGIAGHIGFYQELVTLEFE